MLDKVHEIIYTIISMYGRIISITELRRNFGELTDDLAISSPLILTKGGVQFAILSSAPEEKRKILKKSAGSWATTSLDDGNFWKSSLNKKSRTKAIKL